MASSQEPVSMGIFASNQYKPSIYYEELEQTKDRPPAWAQGLTNYRLLLTPKSWSLTKIQRQSLTL